MIKYYSYYVKVGGTKGFMKQDSPLIQVIERLKGLEEQVPLNIDFEKVRKFENSKIQKFESLKCSDVKIPEKPSERMKLLLALLKKNTVLYEIIYKTKVKYFFV